MLRQASGRIHRSQGFKVKHALQICLLVAICIWLLYQVKHSHEKKRAFEERNSNISNKVTENQAGFFKFGRKDLPHAEKTGSVNESQNKEDENEETQEEHDIKQEEIEDEEGRGAGDVEIDEQDQDKGDEESGHGEESTDEVDRDSREEDRDSCDEDEDGHDEVHMFDSQEHEGGTQEAREENYKREGGIQEAREENYKRDDASSAVHDAHETESETGSGGATNADVEQVVDKVDDDSGANGSKPDDDSSVNGAKGDDGASADGSNSEVVAENVEKKVVESENVTNADDGSRGDNDLSAGSGGASVRNVSDTVVNETIQTGNLSSNVTAADIKDAEVDNKDVEVEFSKPDNGIVSNSTAVEGNNQMEQQTNLTTAAESNTQMELLTNSTGSLDHQIEMQNNSTVVDPAGISTSNNTASLVSAQNQNFTTDNATPAEDAHSSQNMEGQAENSDTTSSVLESEEHSTTSTTDDNGDAAQGGSDNSEHAAITEEEKDARMDLSILPDIQNEAKTTDDEAAE